MLIDTHCHFNHEKLQDDLPQCIERARTDGVMQMIVVGYDLDSSEQAIRLAEDYPATLYAAVGVHPHDAKSWNDEAAVRLGALCDHPQVVALGEIGLDFYRDLSPRAAQFIAFRDQIAIARRISLPVIIHCRDAYAETLQVLTEEGGGELKGVMHCWAGTPEQARQTTELGFALGFGGTLTFKNAETVRVAAREAPLEALLVETDSPYLAPVPFRGQRNEPAYTRFVADALGLLRGLPPQEIESLTTSNARRIFPRLAGISDSSVIA